MTYLIAQIWLFIAVAAAVGLLFGWMFRGGVSGARLRELRHSLAHAEAEAAEQRREAAELAARAERRSAGASTADVAHLQIELRTARDRMTRLETESREARNAADRYAEEAEELRQRIADLTSRGGGAGADERAAWRARVTELEQEADSLRRRLEMRDDEAGEVLRERVIELEAEGEALRERLAQIESRADGDAPEWAGEERVRQLEAEGAEQRARIASLEGELKAARGAAPAGANGVAQELAELRAEADRLRAELADRDAQSRELDSMRERIGTLQTDLDITRNRAEEAESLAALAATDSDGRPGVQANGLEEVHTESARLKWRNSYLTSRIHFLESRLTGQDRPGESDEADEGGSLAAANAEVARLTARIAELERATMPDKSGQPAPNVDAASGSLEWRNRYLASRVRYLEDQLKHRDAGVPAASDEDLRFKLAQAEEKAKDVAKLRARLAELEHVAEQSESAENAEVKTEVLRALEWRVRYLSSRVKYLEDRLSKSDVAPESEPTDAV